LTASDPPATSATRWHRRPRVRRLVGVLLSPSKFAVVGILGIVVNQAALYVFTEYFAIYYLWSAVLASQVSTLNNFILTELWVFRGREARGGLLFRYLAFNLLNISTLFIRVPVLFVLTDVFGIYYMVSNLIAIGVTFGVRYLIADNWIWAGRDQRIQRAIDGMYHYDIHGIVSIRSAVHLPELAEFNVAEAVDPDVVIRRRWIGGGPHLRVRASASEGVIRYREHLGGLGAAFDLDLSGRRIGLDANWLLTWSHHVLYTNMVEPVLRFLLVSRGYALLHCAAVDAERGAIILSAETDTGKTSTVLRLLMHRAWGFIADDMAIVDPDGSLLSYPKPMTLSSHTMSAVNEKRLPMADRFMLAIRSRVHSREGRSIGHALSRLNVPIVTINAWVQLLVPPPKYHVQSLLDCDLTERAPIDTVVLMERGAPLVAEPELDWTLDRLLSNTDDAYTFPPFASLAPLIAFDGAGEQALRSRERSIIRAAIARAGRVRLRVAGHSWSEVIPSVVERRAPALQSLPDDRPLGEKAAIAVATDRA
jgi:putative flippase GtrA